MRKDKKNISAQKESGRKYWTWSFKDLISRVASLSCELLLVLEHLVKALLTVLVLGNVYRAAGNVRR